jgi:type I restriction enzyme S subunit
MQFKANFPNNPNDEPLKMDCKNPIIRRDNSYYEVINGRENCIDNEIPFEVPNNWSWLRLGPITNYGSNISVRSSDIPVNSNIIELEDIEKNSGKLLKTSSIPMAKKSVRHKFKGGDILYSKLRPYLNKVAIPEFDGYCSSEIMVLSPVNPVLNGYLQLSLMSPYFIDFAVSKSYGCKMPRLGMKDGKNALIPIPPVSEQKRIISKVKELQSVLDSLE